MKKIKIMLKYIIILLCFTSCTIKENKKEISKLDVNYMLDQNGNCYATYYSFASNGGSTSISLVSKENCREK